jgi:ribosomal protein S7
MGKLINVLINKGHRQTVEREVKLACKYLKIQFKVIPLELLLEGIEKVKPVFGIDYVTVGGRKKEFPVFLGPEHQRGLSVQ